MLGVICSAAEAIPCHTWGILLSGVSEEQETFFTDRELLVLSCARSKARAKPTKYG